MMDKDDWMDKDDDWIDAGLRCFAGQPVYAADIAGWIARNAKFDDEVVNICAATLRKVAMERDC